MMAMTMMKKKKMQRNKKSQWHLMLKVKNLLSTYSLYLVGFQSVENVFCYELSSLRLGKLRIREEKNNTKHSPNRKR